MRRIPVIAVAACLLAVSGCGGDDSGSGAGSTSTGSRPAQARTLRVPAQYKTIQQAVDAAKQGDTVLIAPGTYHEAVTVKREQPGITIRGTDRNTVILDGNKGKLVNGITVRANDGAVENLTVRYFAVNGVVFSPDASYGGGKLLEGWRGSYITAYDNGLYGVYAFGALNGSFDHVYASGHPDSGIYVGQCRDCGATVSDSIAERNAVGFEDTNASGVVVKNSIFQRNRIGALLNSNSKEDLPPQTDLRMSDNTISDNDNPDTPSGQQGFGAGVAISGSASNIVEGNKITGQPLGVIVLDADPGKGGYPAKDNEVHDNQLSGNTYDLVLATPVKTNGNCFENNKTTKTFPADIETKTKCGASLPLSGKPPAFPSQPKTVPFLTIAPPGPQPTMPGVTP